MGQITVAEIEVTDPEWVADYLREVTPMVERHGGRCLARTGRVEILEGDRPAPQTMLLIEWPSREAADAFYESEEYRPFRERRLAGSRGWFAILPAGDFSGRARI